MTWNIPAEQTHDLSIAGLFILLCLIAIWWGR